MMKQIKIVFSKSTSKIGIFSWLIMAVEKTPYSHVALRMVDSETGDVVYFQASHTFVNCMAESQFTDQEDVVDSFTFEVDEAVHSDMKHFALQQLGKPYGVLSILGLAWVQICAWCGVKRHNPFRDNGQTYICDQFVASLVRSCTEVTINDVNDLTPKDLYPMVKSWPKTLTSRSET